MRPQLGDHGRVIGRHEGVEHPGGTGRPHAFRADIVLHRQGHGHHRRGFPPPLQGLVETFRLRKGRFLALRQIGVHLRLDLRHPQEVGPDDLRRRDIPGCELPLQFRQCEFVY